MNTLGIKLCQLRQIAPYKFSLSIEFFRLRDWIEDPPVNLAVNNYHTDGMISGV